MIDGINSLIWQYEGLHGLPGCLRQPIAIPQGKEDSTPFELVASHTCHPVGDVNCHLIGSHLLEFVCPLRGGSVLQVDAFDLSVRGTPIIPGQVIRRVVVSQLFWCTKQLSS